MNINGKDINKQWIKIKMNKKHKDALTELKLDLSYLRNKCYVDETKQKSNGTT